MASKKNIVLIGGLLIGGLLLMNAMRPRPVQQYVPTGNATRDNKAAQIMQYVIAAGASAAAIAELIQRLNNASSGEVDSLYNDVQSGQGIYV